MSDLILTKYASLYADDIDACNQSLNSINVYADRYTATLTAFTLPSGRIDSHNMGVYLTAMTNKLYPVDKCKGVKGEPATAHKTCLDSMLKHYGKDRQAARIKAGQEFSLIAKSTPPKKGEESSGRLITITCTPVSVLQKQEEAAAAQAEADKTQAEAIEQELAELAEKDRLAFSPLDIAERLFDFVASQWPDAPLPEVAAEFASLVEAGAATAMDDEVQRTGTDG